MEEKEVKLSVNNLKISFRTDAGKVQAVRNISFDLYKGETLAIVGESGSGKSVTNRAIIGILAGNAIKEGGEIIYDGQDLLKITEDRFHKIRGDKIAMIFQDPMSALNPIMRVGKQLTEAMIIKGKKGRREARRDFNRQLRLLRSAMDAAEGGQNKEEHKNKCANFNKFEVKHLALENSYSAAYEAAEDALSEFDDVLLRIERKSFDGLIKETQEALKTAKRSFDKYVVCGRADELKSAISDAEAILMLRVKDLPKRIFRRKGEGVDYSALSAAIKRARDILAEAVALTAPNFFALGYYLTFADKPLPDMPMEELNEYMHKYLDDNFMLDFIALSKKALEWSNGGARGRMGAAVEVIDKNISAFSALTEVKNVRSATSAICRAVKNSEDKLEIVKDSFGYVFPTELNEALKQYYASVKRNAKEEKRFARQTAKAERKNKSGKDEYKVADKNLADLPEMQKNIVNLVKNVRDELELGIKKQTDFNAKAVALIDWFKSRAATVANKVTRRVAKLRALKLLEEVGIPEPRRRFRQYPFEFSGGMRQRIVIAIALSANPDILICDEPTTALDVTIQSQILELINRIKAQRKLSIIFITHNLGVVANMADRVAVMYAGKIVEIGTSEDIFYSPAHPYTWALLSSMPDLDTKEKLEAIPGTPPNMIYPPKGDAFAERNKYALKIDFEQQPPMFKISETHSAATWLLHPDAPKVEIPKQIQDRIARMRAKREGGTANG